MIGLQELVIKQKIKVSELAKEIGVTPGTIWDWINQNKVPKKRLEILAKKFNVDKEYLNKQVNDISTYKPKFKGFNKYKTIGDITELYVEKRSGEIHKVLIDTEDLPRLIELGYRWYTVYDKTTQYYYVHATLNKLDENGNYIKDESGRKLQTGVMLHSIIMNTRNIVDHIDHDGLDNRKSQLRETEDKYNTKNRKSKNSNNKSGYRNVSWNGSGWSVQLQIDGKNTTLKRFKKDQLDEAGVYAEKMRQKYYGEFAGKS